MSDPLNLDSLAEKLAAATPGPWRLSHTKYGVADVLTSEHDILAKGADLTDAEAIVALRNHGEELIALARRAETDEEITRLLQLDKERCAAIEAAERQVRELREALEACIYDAENKRDGEGVAHMLHRVIADDPPLTAPYRSTQSRWLRTHSFSNSSSLTSSLCAHQALRRFLLQ